MTKGYIKHTTVVPLGLLTTVLLSGLVLSSSIVSADNDSVVDEINITVPVSCTMSGTGMQSHNAEIANGTYTPDIGSTTLHAFCNDNEGFAIYAAGYTGDEVGGTNSNKLVGTTVSSNATIVSGIATTAGNPDISNWAMKLAISQDSGDATGTNAYTIDSAPNTSGGSDATFSQYHVVPNEYTKVVHKNSGTDMTAVTGGVKLTTTYAAYISKTQPADTYSGKVIYTLVHPSSAAAPVGAGKVGVTYNANGSTFTDGGTTNRVVYDYTYSPMYIATTPLIAKSSNVANDGTKTTAYASDARVIEPIIAIGATKVKVVVNYGVSSGTGLMVISGVWDAQSPPSTYEMISDGNQNSSGTETYVFDSDSITMYMEDFAGTTPVTDYDYGFWVQVYPIYDTEQSGTELTEEYGYKTTVSVDTGTYTQTTDWYGSWYLDDNDTRLYFCNEAKVKDYLARNSSTLNGTNIYLNASNDSSFVMQCMVNDDLSSGEIVMAMDERDGEFYTVAKLRDGNIWMLENLKLDPTDSATVSNMNADNTNATAEAITNYLYGGSSITGWSNVAVENRISYWNNSFVRPWINNQSRNTLVTSYGPGSVNGQAEVGIYYNYCAATVGTYCYEAGIVVDVPDTDIDVSQDVCPAHWRMPTGGVGGEYETLSNEYDDVQDATNSAGLQYNLSTSLSGCYGHSGCGEINSSGAWWSSTLDLYNETDVGRRAHSLMVTSSPIYIYSNASGYRDDGLAVRCLIAR